MATPEGLGFETDPATAIAFADTYRFENPDDAVCIYGLPLPSVDFDHPPFS